MSPPYARPSARLSREIEHHREIADRAEIIWNWESPSGRRRAARRAAFFASQAGLAPGRRALELGCGTGVFLRHVGSTGAQIRGIDVSQDLLERARSHVAEFPNVGLDCGNAEQLPYQDGSFDAVYGSSVLHHLELEPALKEVARVLRPGGRAVFTEPNLVNPQVALMFHLGLTKRYFGVSPDERAFSRFRAAVLLGEAGLGGVSVRPFDFLHPATPEGWLDGVTRVGAVLEALPLVRELAGSLLIRATKL
jgi:SAM-dependent methyltransferase